MTESRKVRPVLIDGDVAYVTLTKGYVATIDADDAHLVSAWNWRASVEAGNVYAKRTGPRPGREEIRMHRVIAGTPEGMHTDHVDSNGLNNRRQNLRHASPAQNQFNTGAKRGNKSGFKGVFWSSQAGKWQARIMLDRRQMHLGYHETAESASNAYRAAAAKFHGDFSNDQVAVNG